MAHSLYPLIFLRLFISDSWYDKVKPLAYVTGDSKGVRNTALVESKDTISDSMQHDTNKWPVPGVHKVLKILGSASKL
jgi:hypothetical protein